MEVSHSFYFSFFLKFSNSHIRYFCFFGFSWSTFHVFLLFIGWIWWSCWSALSCGLTLVHLLAPLDLILKWINGWDLINKINKFNLKNTNLWFSKTTLPLFLVLFSFSLPTILSSNHYIASLATKRSTVWPLALTTLMSQQLVASIRPVAETTFPTNFVVQVATNSAWALVGLKLLQ